MALAQVSASLSLSIHDAFAFSSEKPLTISTLPVSRLARRRTTFATGSSLFRRISPQRKCSHRATSVSVRCEQSTQGGNSLDVWLGRLAMVGFAVAITVEISTGKGLLENFGLTTPLPTVALAVTALVGVLTAVFIFQSASKN
ncbi:stress enhanced protein 1, chloroplastic [Melia azedarach]|uniref:Stress enhanced protein 1, chloroplastic n=2 Tax=Melia azedarach TaxID=155640 RepID=A0ACC1XZU4_MELAZ|nr:stress enhanced protein 1, chloroplastic [Melia azedarach]KAJ4716254.1 stress enhanced protein 1, chloroplastic [Melia azedarach]